MITVVCFVCSCQGFCINTSTEQAVATSIVYLTRSLGTVWGVAATSTIVQNVLAHRLPDALAGVPNKDKVFPNQFQRDFPSLNTVQIIGEIRHSISAIQTLPSDVQEIARGIYFEAIRISFIATTAIASVAFVSSLFARGRDLNRD